MKLQIFSIHDSKAAAFLRPFCLPSDAHAIREVSEVVQNTSSTFSDYPEDFTLFNVGEFDELTGEVSPRLIHKSLGNLQVLRAELKNRRAENAQVVQQ